MKILKTGCGNTQESFIEDRLTDGVNVIFSNDNNKGKTIIIQGMTVSYTHLCGHRSGKSKYRENDLSAIPLRHEPGRDC